MRFLVTGGAGYIGSHFVHMAIKRGHHCTVLDNLETGHRHSIPSQVPLIVADTRDTGKVSAILKEFQPDVILHYAALCLVEESHKQPQKYLDYNVGGTKSILTAIKNSNSKIPVIFSSSCTVFGIPEKTPIKEDDRKNPISPYGLSKLAAEQELEQFARNERIPMMALRYFNACGADNSAQIGEEHQPETHLIPKILLSIINKEPLTIFGNDYPTQDGTCVRDYIHVMDLAESHLAASQSVVTYKNFDFSAVHLGAGRGYSNLEVVSAAEKVIGKRINYSFAPRRPGDPPCLVADNQKAQKLLGFVPQYSSIEFIMESAWRWHSRNPKG